MIKKRFVEICKYALSFICFYALLNYIRNVFLTPVIYDIFFSETRTELCIVGPYYSSKAFHKSYCVFAFSDGRTGASQPLVVDDPDKNCMIVTFKLPIDMAGTFKYVIMRRKTKLCSGNCVRLPKDPASRKHKLSIATLFKYETDFLTEWIEYHRRVGVEHFYFYENNTVTDQKIAAILAPYIREGMVTHILWPYPYEFYNYKLRHLWPNDALAYTQVPQINHAVYKFSAETEWLLSCDVDEYFYSPKFTDRIGKLTESINMVNTTGDVSSIRIQGFWFGGTLDEIGRAEVFGAGVLKTFIRSEKEPTSACKCIFETSSVRMVSVHNSLVHEKKEVTVSPDILRFNHYRALSWKKRLDEHFAREMENTDILKFSHSNPLPVS